ncbi:serine/threonine protein kinase [Collinsella tanakaei]|uniref:non-specific serine/threonine protein kinase n=2 Tax=Collinsella tanakaei TaxID=626935 RepID=A0A3E4QSG5_9ACTN|nr:serine/threonine protein kinase [Collinsella tanakaei]
MTGYRRRIPGLNSEQVMHAMGIDDAYRVQRVLVRNANGVTELVTIEDAGPFVRKKMPLQSANRAVWAALAGSACPRLPQVAATYEMPDWFVVVYDYVPGESLANAVERAGALGAVIAAQVAQDVCEALSALHTLHVAHLDIAPANIILAADGAHLVDFGNARVLGSLDAASAGAADKAATGSGAAGASRPKGTWGFAAPEQYFYKADERSDIFAAGRLLGYMLTGIQPDDENIEEFEAALLDEDRVPVALRAVVERASRFEPSARYQSVDELSLAIFRALQGDGADTAADNTAADKDNAVQRDEGRRQSGPKQQVDGRRGSRPAQIALVVLACATALMSLTVCAKVLMGRKGEDQQAAGQQATSQQVPGDVLGVSDSDGGVQLDDDNGSNTVPARATASDIERAYQSLKISESGWHVDSNGYVDYALTIQNTSEDLIVEYPEVIITGRAADGSVVFSKSQVMGVVYPGYDLTFACMTGDGTAPATVEFALGKPQDYQVSVGTGHPTEYKVHDLSVRKDGAGKLTVSGEVEKTVEGDEWLDSQSVWLSVILRDDQGQIVYGWNGFVESPGLGEQMPFSIAVYSVPDYATVEVVPIAQ